MPAENHFPVGERGKHMSVTELLKRNFVLTMEVSPSKTDAGMEKLCGPGGLLDQLYTLKPDAVSCAGSNVGMNLEVLKKLARDGKTKGMTRLDYSGRRAEQTEKQLLLFLNNGIDHVILGQEQPGAVDMRAEDQEQRFVSGIRKVIGSGVTLAVEGFAEGHSSAAEDARRLKKLCDSGADHIVTRPCWDMERFYRWLDAVMAADIPLPIVAGVLPAVDLAATIRAALASNGGILPDALAQLVSRNWIYPNPFVRDPFDPQAEQKKAAFRTEGMAFTINQIRAYRACGIGGILLDTRNGFEDTAHIVRAAELR